MFHMPEMAALLSWFCIHIAFFFLKAAAEGAQGIIERR
jgi:hypothetical protein